jgi:branched-subunit amino acid aminotransferase/4-amino-4-deoxychorismate lyase
LFAGMGKRAGLIGFHSAMPTHYIQANTNGRLHAADEPSISPLNRGYLYGDAIYEVWRTYHGVVFAWDEHWQRLLRSAAALHMALPFSAEKIFAEIRRTVEAYRAHTADGGELYIRIQATRGAGAIGLDPALADEADFVLLVQPCPATAPEKMRDGLHLSLATGLRRNPIDSLSPAWKTGNYLNNILCLREARTRGADEVVILNHAGEVTEAAVSNIGFVRDGVVLTPPMAAGILGGITRGFLLDQVCAAAGVAAREAAIRPEDFSACRECFLLSSTKDVTPVGAIDAARFTVGPDTITARLKRAFAELVRAYATAHPQQRV